MKAFIEEYGLSILIAVVSFVLIVMATPLRNIVKRGLKESMGEFKDTKTQTVSLCLNPNGALENNALFCMDIERDSIMKVKEDEGNLIIEILNPDGEVIKENDVPKYDVIGSFVQSGHAIPSGAHIIGYESAEYGTLKAGKTKALTKNEVFTIMWSGIASPQQVDYKGLKRGSSITIELVKFDVIDLKPDEDDNNRPIALIVTKDVYCRTSEGKYTNQFCEKGFTYNHYDLSDFNSSISTKRINIEIKDWEGKFQKLDGKYSWFRLSAYQLKSAAENGYTSTIARADAEEEYWTTTVSSSDTACIIDNGGNIVQNAAIDQEYGERPAAWVYIDSLGDFTINN